ncbi:hypothetical protein MED01_007051 [Micromonospora sp. MED01]|uniref:hypothetical protein n=1 Tax=Micromonospora alfalfae TaxID=2911212 RepID=UPI001EE808DD|nr:hypothetical protein [Micromonospora alfalfae]MCG5462173.1 hypothetical protein [Micromonospora alfalfae]
MSSQPQPGNRVEIWETVAVTALPLGWRNVYRYPDGTVTTDACPAILLQEHRGDAIYQDTNRSGQLESTSREVKCEPPYKTRAIYATNDGGGWLDPVDGIGNYIATIAPDEDPNDYAKPATPPA